jgi:hypothetical protein
MATRAKDRIAATAGAAIVGLGLGVWFALCLAGIL